MFGLMLLLKMRRSQQAFPSLCQPCWLDVSLTSLN